MLDIARAIAGFVLSAGALMASCAHKLRSTVGGRWQGFIQRPNQCALTEIALQSRQGIFVRARRQAGPAPNKRAYPSVICKERATKSAQKRTAARRDQPDGLKMV